MVWLPDAVTGQSKLIIVYNKKNKTYETHYFSFDRIPFQYKN